MTGPGPGDPTGQIQPATAALLNAVTGGQQVARPELNGGGPPTTALDELARLARLTQLIALTAHNSTGRRSSDVEHHAAQLSAALVNLRDEPLRNDPR